MVAGSAGTARAAGSELRGGGGFGDKVILGPRWLPIKMEQGDGLTAGKEGSWWREWRGGGPGGAGVIETVAMAVIAGDEEDDLSGHPIATGGCGAGSLADWAG